MILDINFMKDEQEYLEAKSTLWANEFPRLKASSQSHLSQPQLNECFEVASLRKKQSSLT